MSIAILILLILNLFFTFILIGSVTILHREQYEQQANLKSMAENVADLITSIQQFLKK